MCCWKWENQKIKITPMKIKLKDEIIKQLKVDVSVKTLGLHVNPSLNQNDDYEHVKNKLQISIKK